MESGSGFTPRREFIRDPSPAIPNSFSLLAISGSNCIRLYSFPLPLITALRRLLDSQNLVTNLREDIDQQLCEIELRGKPWTSAKSLPTEKLLLEIIAVIYQHNYKYLSCIDYGREGDDRLAMAFSKPFTRSPLSSSDSPSPPTSTLSNKRIPFALSFTSATMMRVIAPPLHSTPAILQAVRGAWPRGVVSEKKVGDNCFEFKLKGYKWFHEDTFATDSLRYILSLLSALDAHSFTLLTSITLTNRSRIKDLWIFTGPPAYPMELLPESPAPSIFSGSNPEFRRAPGPEIPTLNPTSNQTFHRRLLSEPSISSPVSQAHARAATDNPSGASAFRQSSNVLRKAAPRAQVPVSVRDSDPPVQEEGAPLYAHLPSVVPGNVENFTGIGAPGRTPDVFYSTANTPFGDAGETAFPVLPLVDADAAHSPSATPPSRGGGSPKGYIESCTPVSLSPHLPSTPLVDPALVQPPVVYSNPPTPGSGHILSQGAFRDSEFSSATDSTYDVPIPIKWTGTHDEDARDSLGPLFPGGWQPTPIEEKPEEISGFEDTAYTDAVPTPGVQEVVQRVESPDLQAADLALRKSEAGLVGLIAASENQEASVGEGKGWVVVDVEGQGKDLPVVASPEPQTPTSPPPKATTKDDSSSNVATPVQQPGVSPAAKAIAIVDAIEAKKPKSPTTDSSTSGARKFLSLRRKDSDAPSPSGSTQTLGSESSKAAAAGPTTQVSEDDTKRAIELVHNSDKAKEKPKSRLRDKLWFKGKPQEAQRNEDKRRSIN